MQEKRRDLIQVRPQHRGVRLWEETRIEEKNNNHKKLSRGEICMENFRPPCNCCSFGKLAENGAIWGACQSAENGAIWNFCNNLLYKIQIEWGSVLWKNANLCILGPILLAVWDKLLWEICQLAPNFKFFGQFPTLNPNSKGAHFVKKLPTHLFEAPFCWPFWKIRGLPFSPEWTDLKICQLYLSQNPN